MAHEHDVAQITAVFTHVMLYPSDGSRAVFVKQWKSHFGIKTIVRNDRHGSSFSKRNSDESIVCLASLDPGAAIPENDNRPIGPSARFDDVQPLSAIGRSEER